MMQKFLGLSILPVLLTACTHTYYVVRHAEKSAPAAGAKMNTPDDPPLTRAGINRAERLKKVLDQKRIRYIYSTNTIRTRSTAEPLSKSTGVNIQIYTLHADSGFIAGLKKIKHNTLIVGHSNTVDDLVNGLSNKTRIADLTDSEYDNLFIIEYKRFFGTSIKYERKKY